MKIEYDNLYIHYVFTTFGRAIYANPEHVHFLVSRSPSVSDEELATVVADSSESFINENILATGNFRWQQTASAFSVSKNDVDRVCKYILNQPSHHKRYSFAEEYDITRMR